MYQINSNFSITRLNNAEFVGFFINFRKAVTNSSAESLGVDGIMTAFNNKLEELTDRVYIASGSEYTAAMKAADDRRCLIFRRIRLRLQMVEVADPNSALMTCQEVVRTHLLSKYVSTVVNRAYQERTSILEGFLLDLRTKLDANAIEALGLSEDCAALEDANNEFIAAYAQRIAEKAEGNKGITTRLRNEMYDIYLQMIFIVQYLANSTDPENAEKAATCQAFIAVVNELLSDAKNRLDQRLKTEASEGSGDSENGGNGGNGGSSNSGGSPNSGDSGDDGADDGGSGDGGADDGGSDDGGNGTDPGDNSNDSNTPNDDGVINGDEVTF